MTVSTWIGAELVTVDIEETWLEVFAHWDQLVPTDVAAEIATATVEVLRRHHAAQD